MQDVVLDFSGQDRPLMLENSDPPSARNGMYQMMDRITDECRWNGQSGPVARRIECVQWVIDLSEPRHSHLEGCRGSKIRQGVNQARGLVHGNGLCNGQVERQWYAIPCAEAMGKRKHHA